MKLRVLQAQRAAAELYPPVLHQTNLLRSVADVTLVDCGSCAPATQPGEVPGLRHIRVGIPGPGRGLGLPLAARAHLPFLRSFRAELEASPDIVIAYDLDAAAYALTLPRGSRSRLAVHLHETLVDDPGASLYRRALVAYVRTLLVSSDLIVVADQNRAEHVTRLVRQVRSPVVVMNCPPYLPELPPSLLLPYLRRQGVVTQHVVHYQGAVGPTHGLEDVIASMAFWPDDAVFVIVGAGDRAYEEQLMRAAAEGGVRDRVLIRGRVPYDEVFAWAVGASVGVTLLDGRNPFWRWSAGASNKRFEYLALGIPQVTNEGEGMRAVFGDGKAVTQVGYGDIEAIGRSIASYMKCDVMRAEAGEAARRMHLDIYNYENQFRPVLRWVTNE